MDFHCLLPSFRLIVGQTTCFSISQAPGTSVSRGVRRNALIEASVRHGKERPVLLGGQCRAFLLFSALLKPFLECRVRLLIDHLIPIALVLYHLLKRTNVIFCFRRWSLEMHSLANRLTHDFCLMRL